MPSRADYLVLLGCILAAGCAQSGSEQPATDEKTKAVASLMAYCNKELQRLQPDQTRDLLGHLGKLGLKRDPDQVDQFGPWYVWDFAQKGQPSTLLLFEAGRKMKVARGDQVAFVHPHPGTTLISLTLLDEAGKVVSETNLASGWRCYLQDAKLHPIGDNDYPMVVLQTELGAGPGPDIKRQYYARLRKRFDLVRLESEDGMATRNQYYVKRFSCGPSVAELTESEWEADLLSSERARVLRALVWLGGLHWDLHIDVEGTQMQHEDVDQVKLWEKVRARPMVITRIRELIKSEDVWLREAAELAADPRAVHF